MDALTGCFWIMALGMAVKGLWVMISPRSAWWKLAARSYRNPAANEPSEAVLRFYGGAMIAGALAIVIILLLAQQQAGPGIPAGGSG